MGLGCGKCVVGRIKQINHGLTSRTYRPPEYQAWADIVKRCTNSRNREFENYGGRGISVCQEWRHSFPRFLLDVGLRPTPFHTIDRIDNEGNYEPGNVRWSLMTEQANNKRTNHRLTISGVTMTVRQWANHAGLKLSTLHSRIFTYRWEPERAIAAPVRRWGR